MVTFTIKKKYIYDGEPIFPIGAALFLLIFVVLRS